MVGLMSLLNPQRYSDYSGCIAHSLIAAIIALIRIQSQLAGSPFWRYLTLPVDVINPVQVEDEIIPFYTTSARGCGILPAGY